MEYITGRISFIGEINVVYKNNDSFSKLVLVIRKKVDKKNRNIAFECYGRLADKIAKESRINDKVEVDYIIQSNMGKNNVWYTNLIAKSVEKLFVKKKQDINQTELL